MDYTSSTIYLELFRSLFTFFESQIPSTLFFFRWLINHQPPGICRNLPAAMMVVKTFLVIMEAMPPTMLGPSMGCKSAPKTSAEQVPVQAIRGDQT